MRIPIWVIDTNVLVSAALTAGGACDRVLRAAVEGKVRLAWSATMVTEYRAVLSRPKFKLSASVVSSILAVFGPTDQVPPGQSPVLPDPDDEVFLAAALATSDQILITGNRSHFPVKLCTPAQILSPNEALQRLSAD